MSLLPHPPPLFLPLRLPRPMSTPMPLLTRHLWVCFCIQTSLHVILNLCSTRDLNREKVQIHHQELPLRVVPLPTNLTKTLIPILPILVITIVPNMVQRLQQNIFLSLHHHLRETRLERVPKAENVSIVEPPQRPYGGETVPVTTFVTPVVYITK
uniref:Uncharacterized protein n=1 Tax=Cacopsylla melanoneura TaxID=428564 RepID=A0A8D8QC34_9HEMI